MPVVPVALGGASYDIVIEPGLLAGAGAQLKRLAPRGVLPVVTDATVATIHLGAFSAGCAEAGLTVVPIVVPPGEGAKSWAQLERVTEALLAAGTERGDTVVALGGGVVGDLTGFACAILKRGCRFVQVPTTLLAQVDSSVGGKTAINTAAGKNLAGAFHQPSLVLIDPAVLATLPPDELRYGYAEVVKYGLLGDAAFFGWCEANAAALLAGDLDALTHAITVSCRAKAAIVAADERETNDIRALLNLGHTFGHALEAETGFRLPHGEGVAIGMALAFGFSAATGRCPAADAARVTRHLHSAGLPTRPAERGITASGAALVAHMAHDKKMTAGRLPFILARGIGQAHLERGIELTDVAAFLDADLEHQPVSA